MKGTWFLTLATAIAGTGAAAQTETQHALDASFGLGPRLDLVLHAHGRTQPAGLGFYQVRGGPVFEYRVRRDFKLIGGYYYAQQENLLDDFIGGHRWFGGAETGLWTAWRARVDLRGLAERFQVSQGADFGRYRIRLRVSGRRALAPYAGVENFLDAKGWRSTRYAAGLRVGNRSRISFDFG